MSQDACAIALSHFPKFGPRSMKQLADYFDSAEAAYKASEIELISAGIHAETAKQFIYFREEFDLVSAEKAVKRAGLTLVTPSHPSYPQGLKTIFDPPQLLYVQGTLPKPSQPHLSIVGARKCSDYGKRTAERFATAAAKAGIIIVSGLAYGIDSYAHHATLGTGTPTIAVLACGHDKITGRSRHLVQQILAEGGAIISEFPLKTPALPFHHPIRNRIVSGMSRATLVIEAEIKSGSLISARSAADQNRDVLAVPGSIESPLSEGTNHLIKEGALPLTSPEELLAYYNVEPKANPLEKVAQPQLSKDGVSILNLLSRQPIHIDEITRKTGLGTVIVAQELSHMELEGLTKQIGGMYYILS